MKKGILAISIVFLLAAGMALGLQARIIASKEPSMIYFALGNEAYKNSDYIKARDMFQNAIIQKPAFAEGHHNLGLAYYMLGDLNSAVSSLGTAVHVKQGYSKAYYSLALVYYYQKDYVKAISFLEKVAATEPENKNAYFDMGLVYSDMFRQKESSGSVSVEDLGYLRLSIASYEKVIGLDKDFPNAVSNKNILQGILNDYEGMF